MGGKKKKVGGDSARNNRSTRFEARELGTRRGVCAFVSRHREPGKGGAGRGGGGGGACGQVVERERFCDFFVGCHGHLADVVVFDALPRGLRGK